MDGSKVKSTGKVPQRICSMTYRYIHLCTVCFSMKWSVGKMMLLFFWVSLVGYVGFVECSRNSWKQFLKTEQNSSSMGGVLLFHCIIYLLAIVACRAEKSSRWAYQQISVLYHIISCHIMSCIAKTPRHPCSPKSDRINWLDLELRLKTYTLPETNIAHENSW